MEDAALLLWVERGKILAGFFVAIGVAGEFLGDFIASPIIKRRDAAQQAEIARLNKEAGDARKSAGEAMERAAHAEEQAAELNKQAENERMARLKIEEQMAPRQFNPKQLPNIISKLSAFKGFRADIGAVPQTFESTSLANQIQGILKASNWSASMAQPEAEGPLGGIPRGVMVRCTSDSRSKAAAVALVEILQEEKISAFLSEGLVGPMPSASHEDPYIFRILVVVGSKP